MKITAGIVSRNTLLGRLISNFRTKYIFKTKLIKIENIVIMIDFFRLNFRGVDKNVIIEKYVIPVKRDIIFKYLSILLIPPY